MNPFSGGRLTGSSSSRTRQAGRSSGSSTAAKLPSPQRALKRQKLEHLEAPASSKYFHTTVGQRTLRPRPHAGPSTSTSSHHSDPIIIDEDDAVDDAPPKRMESKTSSPDPMDLISPEEEVSYAFDQSKPSPLRQFISTLEEKRKSPKDGESTARLRSQHNATVVQESASRLDGNGEGSVPKMPSPPPLRPPSRGKSTARTEAPSKPGKVQTLVTMFNGDCIRHINLQPASRKGNMKPRQVSPHVPRSGVPIAEWATGFRSAVRHYLFSCKTQSPPGHLALFQVPGLPRERRLEES